MTESAATPATGLEIAVVGMAGRFPGAPGLEAFWQNLRDGVDSISRFTDEELLAAGVPPALLADPRHVRATGVLAGADLFDAELFGYSPREAEVMDPQQRVFLECAWEALEDAGYDPRACPGPVGVYGGTSASTYLFQLFSRPGLVDSLGIHQTALAHDKDFLCTRASYKLGLEGPSLSVQTACSTSLVAVHLACQGLLSGECDMALAGGVSIGFPQKTGYLYQEGGVVSPDGRCRTFDAAAQGAVSGQGAGIVVLRRLADALRDGDSVRAVIRGSAINNDGAQKAGFTAPRVEGQARAIRAAQQMAEVDPATISYVEAHGTATELGDPIEIAALTEAFRQGTDRRGFCAVGSVKTNIGHLDAAAGVAGLLKTVLALEHRTIPASLHYTAPNPEIDFAASPFFVNARTADWPGPAPRRAGVSSFGLGGTNAHVVLEEASPAPEPAPAPEWQLLVLSARSEAGLEQATGRWADHLRRHPGLALADVAFTSQTGRRAFQHRRALVCRRLSEAADALAERNPKRLLTAVRRPEAPRIAFLLSGLGDQYPGMGRGLYRDAPRFREEIDRAAELLRPELGADLREVLGLLGAVEGGTEAGEIDLRRLLRRGGEEDGREAAGRLRRTSVAQPALFAVDYALARLWMSWGIEPRALLGYSVGEYVAACLAGTLSLADALSLVARRAALLEELPAGAMLAVPLSEERLLPLLGEGLSLAAVNGPALCVAAGSPEAVAALEGRLAAGGVPCRRLQTSHAFHSRAMEPAAGRFRELLRTIDLKPPRLPWISNVTGTRITADEATDPDYWVRHLCGTVRFADGLAELWRDPAAVLLEAGPGQSLASLALQHPAAGPGRTALASLRGELDRQDDGAFLLRTLAQLWLAGAEPDWRRVHEGEHRRRVPLPTHPFERQRYFLDPIASAEGRAASAPEDRIADPARRFWAPTWKRAVRPAGPPREDARRWLLLLDEHGLGARLSERLESAGCEVLAVPPGGDPTAALGEAPDAIVCLGSVGRAGEAPFEEAQDRGFHALIALAQALAAKAPGRPVELLIVADGLARVERGDAVHPEKATLFGPLRVIPQEVPGVSCRAVDVDLRDFAAEAPGELAPLAAELRAGSSEPFVALRGASRWLPVHEPVRLEPAVGTPSVLRPEGVYLITGGLGGIGLALAEHLARTLRARLVLLGRSLPADRVRQAEALEALGAQVLVLAGDVADEARMREVAERVRERFGRLDGLFHTAGRPGGGLIQAKTREAAAAVLAPKTRGTLALEAAFTGLGPGFLVLFSSTAAWTGGIGQVDYSAANAFLGALARREGGLPTVAIDWCEWKWDAWTAADPSLPAEARAGMAERRQRYGLGFEEGMDALERVLASGLRQVVVSTRDFARVLEERHSLAEVLEGLGRLRLSGPAHPRPVLGTPYVAPATDLERAVAEVWQELLGIGQIGAHDDFFRLGGHSLLGLQVLSRIHEALGAELPLNVLFEAPTVAEMAAVVARRREGEEAASRPPLAGFRAPDAEGVLESLDRLSDEEMDGMLLELLAEPERGPL